MWIYIALGIYAVTMFIWYVRARRRMRKRRKQLDEDMAWLNKKSAELDRLSLRAFQARVFPHTMSPNDLCELIEDMSRIEHELDFARRKMIGR